MKLCKDCKHYNDIGYLCVRGKRQTGIDPVDGSPEYKYTTLESVWIERDSIMPWRCGRKGRHFEARGAK